MTEQLKKVVKLESSDIETILALESYIAPYEWRRSAYEMAFKNKWVVLGLISDQKICGVIVYRVVLEECTLMNLFTSSGCTGVGVATSLINSMFADSISKGVRSVFLEVRSNNMEAIQLYNKLGFNVVNERFGYYQINGVSIDALEMALDLSD